MVDKKYGLVPSKKPSVLLSNHTLARYAGSELVTIDLASEFISRGYAVTIATFAKDASIFRELDNLDVRWIDLNVLQPDISGTVYDLVWAHHFTTLDAILMDLKITAKSIIFSSMSAYEPLECPPIYASQLSLVLANSIETKSRLIEHGLSDPKIYIFPNPVSNKWFAFNQSTRKPILSRIAIVSNHPPEELKEAAIKLRAVNISVEIIGLGHNYQLVTPALLNEFDCVISIGRTVQHAMVLGVPVYCYDRFGGPGYITATNIEKAAEFNFSGRCSKVFMTSDELVVDITKNYDSALISSTQLRNNSRQQFSLEKCVTKVLKHVTTSPLQLSLGEPPFVSLQRIRKHIHTAKNNELFAQLYLDIGIGFTESQSIKTFFHHKPSSQVQVDIVFDVSEHDKLINIRLDPINTYAVIRVHKVELIRPNERIDITANIESNADHRIEGAYYFLSEDTQLSFANVGFLGATQIAINLTFCAIGSDALKAYVDIQDVRIQTQQATLETNARTEKDKATTEDFITAQVDGVKQLIKFQTDAISICLENDNRIKTQQLTDAHQKNEALVHEIADRETEFKNTLNNLQQDHDHNLDQQSKAALARELTHSAKLEALQIANAIQSKAHLNAIERSELAFLASLDTLRHDTAAQQELFDARLKDVQLENWALSGEINNMRDSYVWRCSAPFRMAFNRLLNINSLRPTVTSQFIEETKEMPSLPNQTTHTELEELLSLEDEAFIHSAYSAQLGRSADPQGFYYYLNRLHAGISKIEILAQLGLSKEGEFKPSKIHGLDDQIHQYMRSKRSLKKKLLKLLGVEKLVRSDKKPQVVRKINGVNSLELAGAGINFDSNWYLEQNPDVAASGEDPFKHYLQLGKKEGRHPAFDKEWYLHQYPDVVQSGMEPRLHYERHGKLEGRHPAFDKDWYLSRYPDVAASGIDPLNHYVQHGRHEGRFPAYSPFSADGNNYPKWVLDYDTLTEDARITMRQNSSEFCNVPLISIVMPVYNPNPIWLVEVIESVRSQIYPNWELCIADDLSTDKSIRPILERYALEDSRIKVVFRQENGHISNASNSAIEVCTGEWIALLDHDDILPEHALYWVVDAINKHPSIQMIYSDEDKISEKGTRFGPYFKCDWNEDLFYSHNMFSHLGVYHAQLIHKVGGFRIGLEGSQDYDLALRCIEHIEPEQIHHIPRVLYHWRLHAESTASSSEAKPYAMIAGERAITEHLTRKGINAKAELIVYGYRVRYSLPEALPLVSLIIPTRNGLKLLKQCVDSILSKTTYANYEILIVDNGSDDISTLNYLEEVTLNSKVRVMRDDRPFNYSALNNAAVKLARGEIIGLINNDIEVISEDWLSEMVSHALRPKVGAVGAKLLYPNDTVQHAGVLLGVTGIAAHAHKNLPRHGHGYFSRANLIQSFSAVTAACLVIRKSTYESIGGLNEVDLKVAFNDVDFCIRLKKAGLKNIWTPYAELYHHESATRGHEDSPEKRARFAKEIAYMERSNLIEPDPAYSLNLTIDNDDFSLAWPPRVETLN